VNKSVVRNVTRVLCILLPSMILVCAAQGQEPNPIEDDEFVASMDDTVHVPEVQQSAPIVRGDARPRFQDMVTNVPGDWVSFGKVVVDSRSLPYIGGIGALTGVLMIADQPTNGWSRRITQNSEAVGSISRAFVSFGDGKTHLGLAAAFALYGLAWDDTRALRTASQTVEALLACGISVQVLKRVTGRESPRAATRSPGAWRFFPNLRTYQQHQSRYYAFPSGHISTTMATLTVIAENYPEATWIRPVGYSLMGCLAVSLVNVGYHWYSDFPLGLAMGYMFGMIAAHRHDGFFASLANDSYPGLRVLPSVTREGTGVTLALLF